MVLWIVAGYCLTAVVFYSYLVATAKPDPAEDNGQVYVPVRSRDEQKRRAA